MDTSKSSYRDTEHEQTLYDTTTCTDKSNHDSSDTDRNGQTKGDMQNKKDNELSDSNQILDLSCSKERKLISPINDDTETGLNGTHEEDESIDVVNDIESAVENQTKVDENSSYEVVHSEDRSDTSEESDIESSPVFSHRPKEPTVTMRRIKQEKISIGTVEFDEASNNGNDECSINKQVQEEVLNSTSESQALNIKQESLDEISEPQPLTHDSELAKSFDSENWVKIEGVPEENTISMYDIFAKECPPTQYTEQSQEDKNKTIKYWIGTPLHRPRKNPDSDTYWWFLKMTERNLGMVI